jgi:hypothetical protein
MSAAQQLPLLVLLFGAVFGLKWQLQQLCRATHLLEAAATAACVSC